MGAHNIEIDLNGKLTAKQIDKAFIWQQKNDKKYNGHRDGYSGDFQTVEYVKHYTDKIFNSYNEAWQYCMDNAEKWMYVIAVYYRQFPKIQNNKKITELENKINNLDVREYVNKCLTDMRTTKSKTVTCKNCQSKLNRSFLNSVKCPLCNQILLSDTQLKKIDRLEVKKKELQNKLKLEIKKQQKKLEKSAKINTLIAGWGAC